MRFTEAKQILVFRHHVEAHAGNPWHWFHFRSPVRGLREEPYRDCSSHLVQLPGKTWQEAGRDPKYRLNCSLAFFLAAISASEDISYQTLSQAVSHSRIIFLANSPFLRHFSTGLAFIFCQFQSFQFILSPTYLLHSTPRPFLCYLGISPALPLTMHPISLYPFFLFLPLAQAPSFLNSSPHTDSVPGLSLFLSSSCPSSMAVHKAMAQPSLPPDSRCTHHPASSALEKNVWDFHQISESHPREQAQLEN